MHAAILALLLPLATQALFFGNSCGCQTACQPACPPPVLPVCPPPPVCGAPSYGYSTAPQFQQVAVAPQQQQQLYIPQQGQAYAVGGAGAVAQQQEFVAAPLAAQSENTEVATSGQEAALPEEPAVEETQPAEPAETSETETQTQNNVYDDIVAASGTTHEEYQAAASQRRRYNVRRAPPANFDPKCNSETLKTIIRQNIGDSTSSSKRNIQKAASEEVGGHVDVICSTGTFSYIVNTELYCETEKDGITCFAFRQSN